MVKNLRCLNIYFLGFLFTPVLNTKHCTLHTAYFTLHTAHCTLNTAPLFTMDTVHCELHNVHYTPPTAHCTVHSTHYTLHTAHTFLPPGPGPSSPCPPAYPVTVRTATGGRATLRDSPAVYFHPQVSREQGESKKPIWNIP